MTESTDHLRERVPDRLFDACDRELDAAPDSDITPAAARGIPLDFCSIFRMRPLRRRVAIG